MKKEFNFKGAKRGARIKASETKVSITTRLDADIVVWLKEQAEKRGLPYQTFMNSLLKETMQSREASSLIEQIRAVVREEMRHKKAG